MRLPSRGDGLLTSDRRHQLMWTRLVERRQSICFPEAYDSGEPEPLPGSQRGKRYFVKLAHPGKPGSAASIRTEAKLLGLPAVRHCRAIAGLVAEGEWEGLPFLVKYQIPGPTLAQVLSDPADLSSEEVGALLHEMTVAAAACWDAGYCVADWSPSNANVPARMLLDLGGAVRFGEPVRYARAESPDRGSPGSAWVDLRGVCMLALDIYCADSLARLRAGALSYRDAFAHASRSRPGACAPGLWQAVVRGLSLEPAARLTEPSDLLTMLAPWQPPHPDPPRAERPRGLLGRIWGRRAAR